MSFSSHHSISAFVSKESERIQKEKKHGHIWAASQHETLWLSFPQTGGVKHSFSKPEILALKPETMVFIICVGPLYIWGHHNIWWSLRNHYYSNCFLLQFELGKLNYTRIECLREYLKNISSSKQAYVIFFPCVLWNQTLHQSPLLYLCSRLLVANSQLRVFSYGVEIRTLGLGGVLGLQLLKWERFT